MGEGWGEGDAPEDLSLLGIYDPPVVRVCARQTIGDP